ncbi:hypothetical protein EVG20_g9747 [Dentipellis fragilis]|uniref:Uncharacterized protein n=1 Tax=Dentipellis fragilis TaxID=205917 RepID=A0A4Y9XVQ2_9AGAM|nr:hypothetical protein EVG20_g9747 [Dentipellis fragilis]
MPPRAPPKIFQILVKTHKVTVFLSLPNTTPIATVKDETLSALSADVAQGLDFPSIQSTDDFVISKEVKENKRSTGKYQQLDDGQLLRDVASNWEVLFVQFKDPSGNILPVTVSIPSITDDGEEEAPPESDNGMDVDAPTESDRKGKRKAPPT